MYTYIYIYIYIYVCICIYILTAEAFARGRVEILYAGWPCSSLAETMGAQAETGGPVPLKMYVRGRRWIPLEYSFKALELLARSLC